MSKNPYQPGTALNAVQKTRVTHWLVWSGIAALSLAALCLVATVVGMTLAFDSVSNSPTAPTPTELANGISIATGPSVAAAPLGLLGIVLVIAGLIRRRPVSPPALGGSTKRKLAPEGHESE